MLYNIVLGNMAPTIDVFTFISGWLSLGPATGQMLRKYQVAVDAALPKSQYRRSFPHDYLPRIRQPMYEFKDILFSLFSSLNSSPTF